MANKDDRINDKETQEEYTDEQATGRQDAEYTDEAITGRQDEEYTDEQATGRQDAEYIDEEIIGRQDEEYTDEQVTVRQDAEYTDEEITGRQDEEYTDEQVAEQDAENTLHLEHEIEREEQGNKGITDEQKAEDYLGEETDELRTSRLLVVTDSPTDDERNGEYLQGKDGHEDELTERQEDDNLQPFVEAHEPEQDETISYEVADEQKLNKENARLSEVQEAGDLTESYREYLEKQEMMEEESEKKMETSDRSTETTQQKKIHSPTSFVEGLDTRITGKQLSLSPRTQYKDASATGI